MGWGKATEPSLPDPVPALFVLSSHRNPQLQRIYGTAFFDRKDLDAWLKQQEEARKRDHRKLGKELDLFAFHPAAPGAVFWTHRGTLLFHALSNAMRNLCLRNGYQEIKTPLLYNKLLFVRPILSYDAAGAACRCCRAASSRSTTPMTPTAASPRCARQGVCDWLRPRVERRPLK